MNFIEDIVGQVHKRGHLVCGDYYLCERTVESTVYILCDGVGSGVYANISAIACANRLQELIHLGLSVRAACSMVAESMHRARTEQIPFAAFSVAHILNDGQFTAYSYESPQPIMIKDRVATLLEVHYFTAGYEVVMETAGKLDLDDSLVLTSDGVTQAGLGFGWALGIQGEGVVSYLNKKLEDGLSLPEITQKILAMTNKISGGSDVDDTTVVFLHNRVANEATLMTGPPSLKTKDQQYIADFMATSGIKIACGSSTTDILARELGVTAELVATSGASIGSPPEYYVEGVDIVTEGAITLNQVYNLLGENPQSFEDNTVVEQICKVLQRVDCITFLIGDALNEGHTSSMMFKQLGLKVRHSTVQLIITKLKNMGKLIIEKHY